MTQVRPTQWSGQRPSSPAAYDLGIDLGTTFTSAAVHVETGSDLRVVGLEGGRVQVPSVLLLDDDGSLLVGGEAEHRAAWAPQRVVREFKRRLGDDTPIVVAGQGFSADGVAAEMVRWTADRVAEQHGHAPRRLAVAHPAGWGAYRRRVFTEALAEVGLHDVVLLTEPEAAAAAHAAAGRLPVGRTVAVYDLGGGTFDAAVVRGTLPGPQAPVGLTVLGRGQGLEALGGIDFDEALFWHVCAELGGAVAALDPNDPAVVRAVAGLRRACVAAKETLSVDTEAVVDVRLPQLTTRVRITRGEFEEMITPALRQTVDVLGEVLDSARVRAADLDGVLLVGGSSRIPLVARMLSAELGRPVAIDPDPTTVVARGATWAAAAASGAVRPQSGPFPAQRPQSGPFPTITRTPAPAAPAARTELVALAAHDEPRTEFVGPAAALLAHAPDPTTTPLRLDLRGRDAEPVTDVVGPAQRGRPTSALPPVHAAVPMPVASGLRPAPFAAEPPRTDPRRRRLAIGAGAAAVLTAAGVAAVTVPMVKASNASDATATVAAPTAPAIPAAPAAALPGAGTLPTGTLGSTDQDSSGSSTPVSNKAGTKAATPPVAAKPVVPAAPVAKPVVPAPVVAPAPAAPAPVNPAPVTKPAPTQPAPTVPPAETPKSPTPPASSDPAPAAAAPADPAADAQA